jgi:hypothetical protein
MIAGIATILLFSHSIIAPVSSKSDPLFSTMSFANLVPAMPLVDTPKTDSMTSSDTLEFDLKNGIIRKHHKTHIFSIPDISNGRQVPYLENFSIMDFNRVTGYFLGLGTPGTVDLGRHDELGLDGSFGYGFASRRWEYRLGGEFRLPLADTKMIEQDTTFKHHLYSPPTLAVGAAFHNITSTDDAWRESRLENALDAFFAREDFRNYYKLAGWDGYLAFRPRQNTELRIDWRSDDYQSLAQEVFYGRFGGNKVLPPNPVVAEGKMNSLVVTAQNEHVHTRYKSTTNIFGDSIEIEQLKGCSSLLQVELGHMPASDFGFNRYLLDTRSFNPILHGLSFDTRFRFEATTGDMLPQKMEYLGGPGSLPAFYQYDIAGNRMLLLNTEVRVSLNMLSSFFHSPDFNLVIYNDFAKMGLASDGESILQGFQFSGASSILYNVGVGLGWTSGIQVGATWRTDIRADPRVIFRLERPF